MIKSCNENVIDRPDTTNGYCLDENQKFVIDYFPGTPYPEDIESLIDQDKNEESNDEIQCDIDSSDDECEYNSEDENRC